ncbi:girdin-like [Impatiens glandulifera]|uniref:girdin-like n=1 Tax=Impatiens glandulifera TaxID=253017 RepID=UPI001FB19C03|nr:girdin-like [Impatiens glandulifera]
MFRLSRHNKESKSGERFDFKFSNFQAIQVPKGWDKLYVSIVSVETGKTLAKLSKSSVRSGNCQWSESVSESFWFSQDDSSKEHEESLFKFVVSMPYTRSGILGEATVNMASYVNSKGSAPVILPLKKCNYNTILQVKIQCLNSRPKLRDESSRNTNSHFQEPNAEDHEIDNKSSASSEMLNQNTYPSSKDLGSPTHAEKLQSRQTSYSASGSNRSFDSAEGSLQKEDVSPKYDLNGGRSNLMRRRDSNSSHDSSLNGNYFAEDSPSNDSRFSTGNHSQKYWNEHAQNSPGIPSSSLRNADSSKNLLESAEETIEELRSEARMWERNARKLKVDLDILRKQCSDLSKSESETEMQLSAARTERDSLKEEVEQMKILQKESTLNSLALENSLFKSKGMIGIQKELESEIRLLQESNTNLAQQLQRSQESNIELVDILQELEETIEKQKAEIENLLSPGTEASISVQLEENQSLLLQIQQFQESENKLHLDLRLLEQTLEQKENEIEDERSANRQTILGIETKYQNKMASLESKLSNLLMERQLDETELNYESEADLLKENKDLKEKLQELERDCDELANENLELLFKLKNTTLREGVTVYSLSGELPPESSVSSESEACETKSQVHDLEAEPNKGNVEDDYPSYLEVSNSLNNLIEQLDIAFCNIKKPWSTITCIDSDDTNLDSLSKSNLSDPKRLADYALDLFIKLNRLLEMRITQVEVVLQHGKITKLENYVLKEEAAANLVNLEKEMSDKMIEIKNLESVLDSREVEIKFLEKCNDDVEVQIAILEKEKAKLELEMEAVMRENSMTSKRVDDLQRELTVPRENNLETEKKELELHLVELEDENVQLSERISKLHKEAGQLMDERESTYLELENAKMLIAGLQDQIGMLGTETDTQVTNLIKESQDYQNRWSKAREECESLKIENQSLQSRIDDLTEKCNNIQEENEHLTKQRLEMQEHSSRLEMELKDSVKEVSDYSDRFTALEENLSLKIDDFNLREKKFTSEINQLLQENAAHAHKLIQVENLFNQKTVEVEDLKMEIEKLNNQISSINDEKEKIASEAAVTVTSLQTSKADLQRALEDELHNVRANSELKVQALMIELSNTVENHHKLKTALSEIEHKFTVSDNERQQLLEEAANLKIQLQKIAHLPDENLVLKTELDSCKLEKENLEKSILSVSKDCEDLKAEQIAYTEKVSQLGTLASELEECKEKKAALEERLHEKIQQVESELAQAIEDNNKYKFQLQRFSSEGRNGNGNGGKDRFERSKSSLEAELKDLRDRYLHMSLQYAEVESQREGLVMELKAAKTGKKWF